MYIMYIILKIPNKVGWLVGWLAGWLVGKLCTNSISLFVKSISTPIVTAIPSENMTLLWDMTFETGKL